jgi:hypothetical protein
VIDREAETLLPPPASIPDDLRSTVAALAFGWRGMADTDRVTYHEARALRGCADEVDAALARHSPTDPAPPPSARETMETIPDGRRG